MVLIDHTHSYVTQRSGGNAPPLAKRSRKGAVKHRSASARGTFRFQNRNARSARLGLFDSDARTRFILSRAISPINGNRAHAIGRFAQLTRRMRHRQAALNLGTQRNKNVTRIGKPAYRFARLRPTIVAARIAEQTRTHENIHRCQPFENRGNKIRPCVTTTHSGFHARRTYAAILSQEKNNDMAPRRFKRPSGHIASTAANCHQ